METVPNTCVPKKVKVASTIKAPPRKGRREGKAEETTRETAAKWNCRSTYLTKEIQEREQAKPWTTCEKKENEKRE